MVTVRQLLDDKGRQVWSVQAEVSVLEALRVMAQKDVGALLVVAGDTPVGIVSERDYARKVVLEGRASHDTPVADIMSRGLFHVHPNQTVNDCMAIMSTKKVRHLPVIDNGRVLGMISIGDLVKSIIADQEFVIEQMTQYIGGTLA